MLENVYAQNREECVGIQQILEGHQRAIAVASVTDALENMRDLEDRCTFISSGSTQAAEKLVHRRRRCEAILLGAEIHALDSRHEGFVKAMSAKQQKGGAMVLESLIGLATSIVWRSYAKARARGDRSETGVMGGPGNGAIEGLT